MFAKKLDTKRREDNGEMEHKVEVEKANQRAYEDLCDRLDRRKKRWI